MYFLDMLVIYFTQCHYFRFYFLTFAFYFVPSLGNELTARAEAAARKRTTTAKNPWTLGEP